MTTKQQALSFDGLGISPKILEILDRLKFTEPTPIQHKAIPIAVEGKDVIGIAQTGTGKTLAFGIPMIQLIARNKGQGLILVPTRELALQVEESIRRVGGSVGLKTAVLIGGAAMGGQMHQLKKNPHVIIATPGRLLDHMERRSVRLDRIAVLVLDEADRMLDMGFAPQINEILKEVPKDRQTLLFSATMPTEIVKIASTHMKLPVRVEIAPAGTAAERVEQEIYFVRRDNKLRLLQKLLGDFRGSVLVFSRTKHGASKIAKAVRDMGHGASEIHSNRSLNQRRSALDGFKSGRYRVLVATDIAARGIDVKGIEVVVNYDLPENPEDYVHRIGRTGRAGHEGHAISFATPDQRQDVFRIERLIRTSLKVSQHSELPPLEAVAASNADERSAREADRSSRREEGPYRSEGRAPRQYDRGPRRDSRGSSSRFSERSSRAPRREERSESMSIAAPEREGRKEGRSQGYKSRSDERRPSSKGKFGDRKRPSGSSSRSGSSRPGGSRSGGSRGRKPEKRTFIDFRDKSLGA